MSTLKVSITLSKSFLRFWAALLTTRPGKDLFKFLSKNILIELKIRGLRYSFTLVDYTNIIALSEIFSRETYSKFVMKPGWNIVDAGANIGAFSIWIDSILGNECKIIAVEPEPINFNILRSNIINNNMKNILLINSALGKSTGYGIVTDEKDASGHKKVKPLEWNQLNNSEKVVQKIQIVTLDDLVYAQRYEHIDLLKADIEGAEWEMLLGSNKLITAHKIKRVVMETHSENLHNMCKNYLVANDFIICTSNWSKRYRLGILAGYLPDDYHSIDREG